MRLPRRSRPQEDIIRNSEEQVNAPGPDPAADGQDAVAEAARRWSEAYPGTAGFRALTSLVRGYSATVREVEAVLRPLGLNLSRFELLLLLSFSRAGALPVMRIRDLLMVHGSSVTYLVDRLVEAGWVAREQKPGDRRVTLVRLTDEGRRVIDTAARRLADAGFGTFGTLGEPELDLLSDLLGALSRAARDGEPAAG